MISHISCSIDDLPTYLDLFCGAELHPFFISLPGIGKTTQVEAFAARRRARLITESAALLDRLDLNGLPYTEEAGGVRVSKFAPCDLIREISVETNPDGPETVLYWNEVNAAHESVLPSLYRLFDQRAIGGYHLRRNVHMVADGNPASAMSSGRDLPMALRRRFCWLQVTSDLPTWERWAVNSGIDARILGFFRTADYAKFLNDFDPAKRDRLTYACPANWAKVAKILPQASRLRSSEARQIAFAGLVGMEAGTSFNAYLDHEAKLPDVSRVLEAPETAHLPIQPELLSLMVAGVANRVVLDWTRTLEPAMRLGVRMILPAETVCSHFAEFGVFLFRLLMRNQTVLPKVKESAVYPRLMEALNARPEIRDAVMASGQVSSRK